MSEKQQEQGSQAQAQAQGRSVQVQVHQDALRTAETMKWIMQRVMPATQLAASS